MNSVNDYLSKAKNRKAGTRITMDDWATRRSVMIYVPSDTDKTNIAVDYKELYKGKHWQRKEFSDFNVAMRFALNYLQNIHDSFMSIAGDAIELINADNPQAAKDILTSYLEG